MVHAFLLLLPALVTAGDIPFNEDCLYQGNETNPYPEPDEVAPDTFQVAFNTTVQLSPGVPGPPIVLEITRAWAPFGADRFHSLVHDNYYLEAAFFRVIPDFIVQFGIAADPNMTVKWDTPIPDDPYLVPNKKWTVSFATAGPNTRTTQVLINYKDNFELDHEGFTPFAEVISGFETVLAIFNPTPGDRDGVNQAHYSEFGNHWLLDSYPNISRIICEGEGIFIKDRQGDGSIPGETEGLDYMLIYSFVALSAVVLAIGLLFYIRSRCCKANMEDSEHIALMDFSVGSSVSEP